MTYDYEEQEEHVKIMEQRCRNFEKEIQTQNK